MEMALTTDRLVRALRDIVGDRHVILAESLKEYLHDASFLDGTSVCAVLPASTDEVAAIVRICSKMEIPITPRGAGTGLVGGTVPLAGGVVISLERMNHVEIHPEDLCAIAGAGAFTGQVQAMAQEFGLMYPPDPASVEISSIGGNVSCNAGGMRCLKYGVTADYVIGMTVVLASGRVLRLGGRVRKRASGYRIMSLFEGSEGTLGIITELVLKLIPSPLHRATAMVGFSSIAEAATAIQRLLTSGYLPAALELMDRGALDLVAEHLPTGFDNAMGAVVIVEQDGSDLSHVQSQLEEFVAELHGIDDRIAQSERQREGIWNARRGFGLVLKSMRKHFFAEDVCVPISQIPEMVRRFTSLAEKTGIQIATVGHAGDGNLHPTIIFSEDQLPAVGLVAGQILRDAVDLGGTISAEHGLGALKRDYAGLEHGSDAIGIMREIKNLLDPQGILNPHKMFPEAAPDPQFLSRLPGWGTSLDRAEAGA
jgi:glycolate oxidase